MHAIFVALKLWIWQIFLKNSQRKNVFCEINNFKIISVLLLYSTESPVEAITLKHEEIITLKIIKICKNAMVVSKPAMSSAKPAMSTFELPVFQNQHFSKIQPSQKHD